jgi:hypothetical protein
MCNWRASVGAAIFVSVIAAPASAAPIGPRTVTNLDSSVDKARLVCDEFARCWQSQPEPYGPRTSRRYIYNQVYLIQDTDRWLELQPPNGSGKGFAPLASAKRATAEPSW